MTPTAGYVRGLVAISSYSALFGLLTWFGRRLGPGTRAGVLAGVVGALIPRQGMDEIIGWGVTAHAALALALLVNARRTWLTHISHDLPREETERRWKETTVEWPIMHAVTYGVTRDQMMARHKANHIQVAYAGVRQDPRWSRS